MMKNEIIEALADIFETEDFTEETLLETLPWDSMAMLSVVALAKKSNITLSGATIREFETVGDILAALKAE